MFFIYLLLFFISSRDHTSPYAPFPVAQEKYSALPALSAQLLLETTQASLMDEHSFQTQISDMIHRQAYTELETLLQSQRSFPKLSLARTQRDIEYLYQVLKKEKISLDRIFTISEDMTHKYFLRNMVKEKMVLLLDWAAGRFLDDDWYGFGEITTELLFESDPQKTISILEQSIPHLHGLAKDIAFLILERMPQLDARRRYKSLTGRYPILFHMLHNIKINDTYYLQVQVQDPHTVHVLCCSTDPLFFDTPKKKSLKFLHHFPQNTVGYIELTFCNWDPARKYDIIDLSFTTFLEEVRGQGLFAQTLQQVCACMPVGTIFTIGNILQEKAYLHFKNGFI